MGLYRVTLKFTGSHSIITVPDLAASNPSTTSTVPAAIFVISANGRATALVVGKAFLRSGGLGNLGKP